MRLIFILIILLFLTFNAISIEIGFASWYGAKFHGRITASGEIYDMNKLTAAHKTLPFGTLVRVLNLENEKSVEVKINDRGPFVDERIIDLSKAAAQKIEMLKTGIAKVKIHIVKESEKKRLFNIQVGSFLKEINAKKVENILFIKNLKVAQERTSSGYIRVLVINIYEKDLIRTLQFLNSIGFENVLIREKKVY